MQGFANVSRRSNIIIFGGQGGGGRTSVRKQQSSLFLWGAFLTSSHYITSTYKKRTAQTPKSTILPRTLRNMLLFYFSHCVPEDIVQPNSKSLLKVVFFAEDVVEAEVSPDEDPLRLPSLPLTQTTHRLATEHLQVITMSMSKNKTMSVLMSAMMIILRWLW